MPGIQQPTKTPISESKIAVFWRTALYLFSAGMMGKAAAGFSDGYVAEAVGDLGLSSSLSACALEARNWRYWLTFQTRQKEKLLSKS